MKPRLIGLNATCLSHSPSRLRSLIERAEGAGFAGFCLSDAFRPQFDDSTCLSLSSWLRAAIQGSKLQIGLLGSSSCDWRSPTISREIQEIAASAEQRFWIALPCDATGSDIVESVRSQEIGDDIDAIRIRCASAPHRVMAAVPSPEWAAWAGVASDGLLVTDPDPRMLRRTIDAFDEAGGAGKPAILKLSLLGDAKERDRRRFSSATGGGRDQRNAARHERETKSATDWDELCGWIDEAFDTGVDAVYLDPIGVDPGRFIDECGEKLLSRLKSFRLAA